MQVELLNADLILRISENELQKDPGVIDRAAALALQINSCFSLIVKVPLSEFNVRHEVFGSRWVGDGMLRDRTITLRLEIRKPVTGSIDPKPTPAPKPKRKRRGKKK